MTAMSSRRPAASGAVRMPQRMPLRMPLRIWQRIWQRISVVGLWLSIALQSAWAAEPYDIAPLVPARVVDARYFATHLHRLVAVAEPQARATPWPVGQIGALRLWDSTTRWADLEPSRGTFVFDRLDAYVAQAQSQGVTLLMVLGSSARWAAARPDEPGPYGPGSASEPASLADWERYVTVLARRYKGRIEAYELWNEPYFSDLPADRGHPSAFFTGSVATMVELARRTRAVLEREDPQARLLTPGFVGGVERLDRFLHAGGGRYADGVAYHFYADDDREFIKLHRAVRAVMARHGVSRLPLYNTESGFAADDAPGPRAGTSLDRTTAAIQLARSMVLGAFLGIDRFYQYAWDNGRSGMLNPGSLEATASAGAFAAVRRWLLGTTLRGCRLKSDGSVRCEGSRGGNQLLIVWQASAAPPVVVRLAETLRAVSVDRAIDPQRPPDLRAVLASGLVVGADPVAIWWRPAAAGKGAAQ